MLVASNWLCLLIHVSSSPHADWYCSAMGENQNISESNSTLHLAAKKGLRPHFFIGVSLVLGFTLMFVVDQIASYCSMHGTSMLLFVRNTFQYLISTHFFQTEAVWRIEMFRGDHTPSFFWTSPGKSKLLKMSRFWLCFPIEVLPKVFIHYKFVYLHCFDHSL